MLMRAGYGDAPESRRERVYLVQTPMAEALLLIYSSSIEMSLRP